MNTWKFIKNGNAQQDELGNIVQLGGAVIPKACQQCKKEFNSEIINTPIKEQVPFFKCKNCEFSSGSGEQTLFHLQEFDNHKITKDQKERIVKMEKTSGGIIPYVTKLDDDVHIICGSCNGFKK